MSTETMKEAQMIADNERRGLVVAVTMERGSDEMTVSMMANIPPEAAIQLLDYARQQIIDNIDDREVVEEA